MRGSRSALLLYSALALKISQVFVPQVWSITLLLPERVLPTPPAKLKNNYETAKLFGRKVWRRGGQESVSGAMAYLNARGSMSKRTGWCVKVLVAV